MFREKATKAMSNNPNSNHNPNKLNVPHHSRTCSVGSLFPSLGPRSMETSSVERSGAIRALYRVREVTPMTSHIAPLLGWHSMCLDLCRQSDDDPTRCRTLPTSMPNHGKFERL